MKMFRSLLGRESGGMDPAVREVMEQPNVQEAQKQINRALILIELDRVEAVARGVRREGRRKHGH